MNWSKKILIGFTILVLCLASFLSVLFGGYNDKIEVAKAIEKVMEKPDTTATDVLNNFDYQRSDAVNYGMHYYSKYLLSDGYNFYKCNTGDCAHFVSCAIGNEKNWRGGGLSLGYRWHKVCNTYYYGVAGARLPENDRDWDLIPYLINHHLAKIVNSVDELQPGDIVQYKWSTTHNHVALYVGGNYVVDHYKGDYPYGYHVPYNDSKYSGSVKTFIHIFDNPLSEPGASEYFDLDYLHPGDRVKCLATGLKIREGPGAGSSSTGYQDYKIKGTLSYGETGTVQYGPATRDGKYVWYYISWDNNLSGWTAQGSNAKSRDYLGKISTDNPPVVSNLPDLMVEDIWVDPAEFHPGDTVKLYARIKNIGNGDAVGTFRTKRYFDGICITYYDRNGLAAGASYTSYCSYTWPSDTDSHTIKVVADVDGAITESNRNNNERSEYFSATPPSNQPPTPSSGDQYEPDNDYQHATLISTGGSSQQHTIDPKGDVDWLKFFATKGYKYTIETFDLEGDCDTVIYLYDSCGGNKIKEDDDGGEGRASKIVWSCNSSGTYYIKVRHYSSSKGGPNVKYKIKVTKEKQKKPDLIVDDIFWSPSNPEEGDSVTIKANIKNIGNATANGFDTKLYIDGSSYSTKYTSSLSPDSSTTITFSSWKATSGCHDLKVFVDSGHDAEESNKNNNTKTEEICVEEKQTGDSYENDNTCSDAKTISTDGSHQTHTIDPAGDNDWMKFNATLDSEYTIETGNLQGGCDTYIYLYDRDGTTLIENNDDGGSDYASKIVWTCPASGTYYVRVRNYSSSRGGPDVKYDIWIASSNQPPTLSSGEVSPDSGTTSTTFTYTVHYYDSDGDSPATRYVYIDGSPHTMSLSSGSSSNGTYIYRTTLSSGNHNYYFEFNDGHGHTKRFPSLETRPGPTVTPSASRPSPPRNLRVTSVGDRVVNLAWNTPSSDGGSPITHYRIYRGTCSGCETLYITISSSYTTFQNIGSNVENGVTYYYYVTAVNSVGESQASNEVHATPRSSASRPSPPRNLNAEVVFDSSARKAGVRISWNQPSDNGGSPITKYKMYRKIEGGSYVYIGDRPAEYLYFRDWGVELGKKYYYKVIAINQAGYESDPSNEKDILVGVLVRTTANLNVRVGAGLSYSVIVTLPPNTYGLALGGPIYADGHYWWYCMWTYNNSIYYGWSVENYMRFCIGPTNIFIKGARET